MAHSLDPTTFASHAPQPIDLAAIETELTRFWYYPAASEADSPVTRACMANLVIFCRKCDEEQEILQEIPVIVARHPSRVLFLVGCTTSQREDLDALVGDHY